MENEYNIVEEEVSFEKDENGNVIKVVTKYIEKKNKYYENIKKAIYTYREKNREELNKKSADKRREKYNTDPTYKELIKNKQKEYYQKNKNKNTNTDL
jgi:hypothetical protein